MQEPGTGKCTQRRSGAVTAFDVAVQHVGEITQPFIQTRHGQFCIVVALPGFALLLLEVVQPLFGVVDLSQNVIDVRIIDLPQAVVACLGGRSRAIHTSRNLLQPRVPCFCFF